MKYNYEFLDETVEVEVSKEWMEVLLELDQREYNNNHTETRRHISLDRFNDRSEVLVSKEPDLTDLMILKEEVDRVEKAITHLTCTQKEAINAVCYEDISITDFAESIGIGQSAASQRIDTARKRIKKFLQKT